MKTSIHLDSKHNQQLRGLIKGYASFFDVIDQQRDRVTRGAFAKSLRAWRILGKMPNSRLACGHAFVRTDKVYMHKES